jgi:uncharacterized protein YegL
MAREKIAQLNGGMSEFGAFVRGDKLTAVNTELAVVRFGGSVRVAHHFTPAELFEPPVLEAGGDSPIGDALLTALKELNDRVAVYRQNDVGHHVPWMMLITDGEETVNRSQFDAAGQIIRRLEQEGKLRFFAVGVDGCDMAALQSLTIHKPYLLRGLNFRELFRWLGRSLRTVSRTQAGAEPEVETPADAGIAD